MHFEFTVLRLVIFFFENYVLSLDGDLYFLLQNIGALLISV